MYSGWELFLFPFLFFLIFWVALAWWPAWYYRRDTHNRRFMYPYEYEGRTSPYLLSRHQSGRFKGRGPRNYRRSDERIREDISDRLLFDEDVDATGMEVHVENGEVTLSGFVPTRSQKRIAEWIADSVPGVTDVKNQLKIGKESADVSEAA